MGLLESVGPRKRGRILKLDSSDFEQFADPDRKAGEEFANVERIVPIQLAETVRGVIHAEGLGRRVEHPERGWLS